MVVAGFRDRLAFNPEVSTEAAIAGWHIISEGIAVDIFAARYRACTEPVTREVLRLILQDEVRHVALGWEYLEHRVPQMNQGRSAKAVQNAVLDIIENVEMKGFHSMCLLPRRSRKRSEGSRSDRREGGPGLLLGRGRASRSS